VHLPHQLPESVDAPRCRVTRVALQPPIDVARGSQPYLPFIDGLRGLAVLGVIFFHFHVAPLSGGYVGVDVFFVLSGYLITNLIDVRLPGGGFLSHIFMSAARVEFSRP
jgi:peptidoglycan/LPS O-acetylase OafA/YrhL